MAQNEDPQTSSQFWIFPYPSDPGAHAEGDQPHFRTNLSPIWKPLQCGKGTVWELETHHFQKRQIYFKLSRDAAFSPSDVKLQEGTSILAHKSQC